MQRTPSDSPFLNNHQVILEIPFSSAAIWDDIEHPGWSSPNSPEMPDVQYSVVYGEIPDMIEAKAFTLAQTGPNSGSTPSVLHSGLQEVLARPSNMSLRDYITHLSNYNVITQSATVSSFLTNYERAKYSTRPLPGAQFREMMAQFAQILQSMQPLDLTSRETASLFGYDDDDTSLHSSLAFGSHSFHYANNSAERSLGSEPSIRSSLSASPNATKAQLEYCGFFQHRELVPVAVSPSSEQNGIASKHAFAVVIPIELGVGGTQGYYTTAITWCNQSPLP
ncbi:hypothetical protein CFO_g1155 [Ceratocystis platani]|uniref:Defect at low temperature protein 1 n=1 Tax=Ceratocystis fimbriata f. sp. platani TaxID=88771 RepID=A0A0F8B423_CERFI|nr:hypothetical protein CFO_g1155 [Ceratocystis platani]